MRWQTDCGCNGLPKSWCSIPSGRSDTAAVLTTSSASACTGRRHRGATWLSRWRNCSPDEKSRSPRPNRSAAGSAGCGSGPRRGDLFEASRKHPARRCVACHRPGEIAPFALTTYKQAAGWAETIAEVVGDGRMPPWHASPAHGKFRNDAHLADDEKRLIAAWVADGAPEGDPRDCPDCRRMPTVGASPSPTSSWKCRESSTCRPGRLAVPVFRNRSQNGSRCLDPRLASAPRAIRRSSTTIVVFALPPDQTRCQSGRRFPGRLFAGDAAARAAGGNRQGAAGRREAARPGSLHAARDPQTDRSKIGFTFADPTTITKRSTSIAAIDYRLRIPPARPITRVLPSTGSTRTTSSTRSCPTCTCAASRFASRRRTPTAVAKSCSMCRVTSSTGRTFTFWSSPADARGNGHAVRGALRQLGRQPQQPRPEPHRHLRRANQRRDAHRLHGRGTWLSGPERRPAEGGCASRRQVRRDLSPSSARGDQVRSTWPRVSTPIIRPSSSSTAPTTTGCSRPPWSCPRANTSTSTFRRQQIPP